MARARVVIRRAPCYRHWPRRRGCPIQFAGGLCTEDDVAEVLAHGATRAILGSAAAHDAALLAACLAHWDERLAVSLEARGEAVTVAGWLASTSETVAEFAGRMVAVGVRTLLMTDVEPDGSLTGGASPRLLRLRAALPAVRLLAAGGIATVEDVRRLARAGIDGAVVGRALYEDTLDVARALAVATETTADSTGAVIQTPAGPAALPPNETSADA